MNSLTAEITNTHWDAYPQVIIEESKVLRPVLFLKSGVVAAGQLLWKIICVR